MTSWRHLLRVLPWLVAPSVFVGACGRTEHSGDEPSTAGKTSRGGASSGTVGPTSSSGTASTQPRAGAPGRGGGPAALPGEGGYDAGPALPPGLSNQPVGIDCKLDACFSSAVGPLYVDPCCAGEACGLDSGFLALLGAKFPSKCLAKGQPGVLDASCPATAPRQLPVQTGAMTLVVPLEGFAGCCRADGKCGVVVDNLVAAGFGTVAKLGLGCVDSAPFFNNVRAACGPDVGGAGGESGFGGANSAGEAGAAASTGGAP